MTIDVEPSGRCRFRVLTAPGSGAVAVIELTCEAVQTVQHVLRRLAFVRPGERSGVSPPVPGLENSRHFPGAVALKIAEYADSTPSLPAALMSIGRICYGRWNDEDLVTVRTSVRTWEIQCHGGTAAVNRICTDLLSDGALSGDVDAAVWPIDTGNLAVNGKAQTLERIQSIVMQAIRNRLANARSRKTAGLILAQASNSLCRDLMTILETQDKETIEVTTVRQRLAAWQDVADHLTEPWCVVFAGAPNVGKSSLMNRIAGMERSIVCDQPGTTRDVVEVDGVIEGWPFRFVDTAGLRENSHDPIEKLGIEQSHLAASQCDVLCIVFDNDSDAAAWSDRPSLTNPPKRTVLVRNKCDLMTEHDVEQRPGQHFFTLSGLPLIPVSAHTGQGLTELLQWIKQSVVPEDPDKDTALPVCSYCFDAT